MQLAKRAFVVVLRSLAALYSVKLAVTRDSPDQDGEPCLHTKASKTAYAAENLQVWQVPPSSPDLNPVEKFWGWLRKQLRSRDLGDLSKKRPVLTKTKYKARVKAICSSAKAQSVAKKFTADLRNVCKEVVAKKGQRNNK